LTGFAQEHGFRRFDFEGIEADHTRSEFTVRADLALIRNYGIHVQDLPLLCRELLERADSDAHRLTFTEEDMRQYQANRLTEQRAADQKKRHPRRPVPASTGNSWRTSLTLGNPV
jgi:hypothetical protein